MLASSNSSAIQTPSGRDCDCNESTNAIANRDRCAAGRARDASNDEGETRGGKGGCTGGDKGDKGDNDGGRDGDKGCEEGCAGLPRHSRLWRSCNRLRDDAAQGDPIHHLSFLEVPFVVTVSMPRSSKREPFLPSAQVHSPGFEDTAGNCVNSSSRSSTLKCNHLL
jgi:hypothetical protein